MRVFYKDLYFCDINVFFKVSCNYSKSTWKATKFLSKVCAKYFFINEPNDSTPKAQLSYNVTDWWLNSQRSPQKYRPWNNRRAYWHVSFFGNYFRRFTQCSEFTLSAFTCEGIFQRYMNDKLNHCPILPLVKFFVFKTMEVKLARGKLPAMVNCSADKFTCGCRQNFRQVTIDVGTLRSATCEWGISRLQFRKRGRSQDDLISFWKRKYFSMTFRQQLIQNVIYFSGKL